MGTSVSVSCLTCGEPFQTTIDSAGRVDACYGHVLTVAEDEVTPDATPVGEYLDDSIAPDHIAVILAECKACCPNCSHSP